MVVVYVVATNIHWNSILVEALQAVLVLIGTSVVTGIVLRSWTSLPAFRLDWSILGGPGDTKGTPVEGSKVPVKTIPGTSQAVFCVSLGYDETGWGAKRLARKLLAPGWYLIVEVLPAGVEAHVDHLMHCTKRRLPGGAYAVTVEPLAALPEIARFQLALNGDFTNYAEVPAWINVRFVPFERSRVSWLVLANSKLNSVVLLQ